MFGPEQIAKLKAPLNKVNVKQRKQGGSNVSYIEGWHAISEANEIFGFCGWSRDTIDIRCVSERERAIGQSGGQGWGVSYVARVRITVDGVVRDGCGAGHGIDRDLGQAHESAIKEAETDAMKRALMTFGNPFGLALYDKTQANVSDRIGEAVVAKKSPANQQEDASAATDASRSTFIESTAKAIRGATSESSLRSWWESLKQKKFRRDFGLEQREIDDLLAIMKEQIETINSKAAA